MISIAEIGNRHPDRHLDGLAPRLRRADAVVAAQQKERAHRDRRPRRRHDDRLRETSGNASTVRSRLPASPAPPAASPDWKTDRSKPPLNTRWLPASTTALASSFSARSSASLMAACIVGPEHVDLAVVQRDRRDGFVELVVHRAGHRASSTCATCAFVSDRCYETMLRKPNAGSARCVSRRRGRAGAGR